MGKSVNKKKGYEAEDLAGTKSQRKKGLKAYYEKAMAGKESFGMRFTGGAAGTESEKQLNTKSAVKTAERQQKENSEET